MSPAVRGWMASIHDLSAMNQSHGEADSRSWHSPPSMPSPIPFQGSSEAPLEVSAISASLHDSFGAGTAAQSTGMAEAASHGWEWKYAATSSGAGWSETGQWSHAAGTWSQADWQRHRTRDQWIESSAQPPSKLGGAPSCGALRNTGATPTRRPGRASGTKRARPLPLRRPRLGHLRAEANMTCKGHPKPQ